MPYCTLTDILNLEYTEKELIELTDDLNVGPINAAMVAAAIAKADADIDAHCQAQYTVPFGPSSEVLGPDMKNYTCIVPHTASALNKPVTGANYATYWAQKGSSGGTWVDGSAYTAVPGIVTGWSATLAAFNLARNRTKSTTLIDRYNKVMAWLTGILKGDRTIPGVTDVNVLPVSTTDDTAQTFRRTQTDVDGNLIGDAGTMDVW